MSNIRNMGLPAQTQIQHPVAGAKPQKSKVKLAQSHLNFTPSSQPSEVVVSTSASTSMTALTVMSEHSVVCSLMGENPVNTHKQDNPMRVDQNSDRTWSDVVNESERFVSNIPIVGHKPEIAPVFLNFKCVAWEGFKIPLEVAAAVGKVSWGPKCGWCPTHEKWLANICQNGI